jgi:transposase
MRRHELSDSQWEQLAPLLPPNGKRGGQWKDHRLLLNGILWVLATGAAWRDLPERFGPFGTVYDRFRKWSRNGLWQRILERLQVQRQADGQIDWDLFFIDGSVVRAHKAAAGARKKNPPRRAA